MKYQGFIPIIIVTLASYHISGVHSYRPYPSSHGRRGGKGIFSAGIGRSLNRGHTLRGNYGLNSRPPVQTGASKLGSRDTHDTYSLLPVISTSKWDEKSKILNVTEGTNSFVQFLVECVPILKYCLLNSVGSPCPLACLLDNSKEGRHLIYIFRAVTRSLCSPVGTLLDSGVGVYLDRETSGKKVKNVIGFLEILNSTNNGSRLQVSHPAAAALPMVMIKYLSSPILDTLKSVVVSLLSDVQLTPLNFDMNDKYKNPSCQVLDYTGSQNRLAEKIIQNPFSADVSLGGWFVLSNLVHLNLQNVAVSDMVDSVFKVMTLMIGVQCSLIQYAETGKTPDCKSVAGAVWSDTSSERPKLGEVCGHLEDVPLLDLNAMFPSIFPNKSPDEDMETGPADVTKTVGTDTNIIAVSDTDEEGAAEEAGAPEENAVDATTADENLVPSNPYMERLGAIEDVSTQQ